MRVTEPTGITQITTYDDVANTTTTGYVPDPRLTLADASRKTTTQKDSNNRDVQVTGFRKDNVTIPKKTITYDGLGQVLEKTSGDVATRMTLNPEGTPKTTTKTPLNSAVFSDESIVANRDYDLRGISVKKDLSQGNQTREGVSRVVDAAGRTVSETDQIGNTTTMKYTVDGLVSVIHQGGSGLVINNTYDPATRSLTVSETVAPDGSVSKKEYEYDRITGKTIAVYDPFDKDHTLVRYTYDVFGNLTSTVYPDGTSVSHIFDEHGKRLSSTDVVGAVTVFSYDRYARLATVTQSSTEGVLMGGVEYHYDEYSRVHELSRANGVTTRYTFTSADEIATETTTHNEEMVEDAAYTYDSHGNLVQQVDKSSAVEQPNLPKQSGTHTTTYTYDAYDRLLGSSVYKGETAVGEPDSQVTYEINVSGDVTKETTTKHVHSTVREFEYNSLGHLTAIITDGVRAIQTYDGAGNLRVAYDGTTYSYNAYNQPVDEKHSDGTRVDTTYWATGKPHTITTHLSPDLSSDPAPDLSSKKLLGSGNSESSVSLYWDENRLVNDSHTGSEAETNTASYLYGTSRHTRTFSNTPTDAEYYITDRHGNTVATTNTEGGVTSTSTYTDYGISLTYSAHFSSDTNPSNEVYRNPFLFSGEYTTSTGMQLLGNRVYDPVQMRFTTHDVAELHNLYNYANTNPITMVDPSGHTPELDWFATVALNTFGAAMAVIGIGLALTGPLTLASAIIAFAGFVDLGTVPVQIANSYANNGKGFMDKSTATALAITTFVLGASDLAAGIFNLFGRKYASEFAQKQYAAAMARCAALEKEGKIINAGWEVLGPEERKMGALQRLMAKVKDNWKLTHTELELSNGRPQLISGVTALVTAGIGLSFPPPSKEKQEGQW